MIGVCPSLLPARGQAHLRIGNADTCLGLLAALNRWFFPHPPHKGSYTIVYLLEERKEEVAWFCPPSCVLASAVTVPDTDPCGMAPDFTRNVVSVCRSPADSEFSMVFATDCSADIRHEIQCFQLKELCESCLPGPS